MNATAWPEQPTRVADELFNRLVGLFRVFSEECSSAGGKRTLEKDFPSDTCRQLLSHLVKVDANSSAR
jgi:hypothetical protein